MATTSNQMNAIRQMHNEQKRPQWPIADHCCISTSGARPNPQWLAAFLDHGLQIYCGFDTDPTGQSAAEAMLSLYPAIQRLRPSQHDWNAVLISQS